MKSSRQDEILRIIRERDVETQEELASELRKTGYKVTQATVSRDIRELKLIKVAANGGGFKYAKPERHETAVSDRLTRILNDSLVNVDFSGNIVKAAAGLVDVKEGDRVLVHAGCIIQKVSDEEASKIEELFRELEEA